MKPDSLLFVYNADGAPISAMIEAAHKIVSPSTYECNLCKLTYGAVSMKRDWREFLQDLDVPVEFGHRDEFTQRYEREEALPCLFAVTDDELELIIDSDDINEFTSLEELTQAVEQALEDYRTDS